MKIYKLLLFLIIYLVGCKPTSDRILFSSNRNGNSDIYLIGKKGAPIKQITSKESEEWSPVWISKNEISYLSQKGENISVLKHNIKTNEVSELKHPENCLLDDKNRVYSLKSDKQLYSCKGEVYLIDNKNKKNENVTEEITGTANYIGWGQSINEITFTSNHEGNNEIYILNIATNRLRNITNNKANDERGDISPDGRFIVFSSDRFEKGNQDIVIQNLITNDVKRITATKGTELIARWSTNNNRIYYGSNKDGNWELYYYDLKEEKAVRLTNNEGFDGDPRIN